jgi:Na+-transporting NADH:ubiquinone oxidoreductase subunit NqrC
MKEHKEKEEQFTKTIVVLLLLALACTMMAYVHHVVGILKIFPESIWAIFIGIGLG